MPRHRKSVEYQLVGFRFSLVVDLIEHRVFSILEADSVGKLNDMLDTALN